MRIDKRATVRSKEERGRRSKNLSALGEPRCSKCCSTMPLQELETDRAAGHLGEVSVVEADATHALTSRVRVSFRIELPDVSEVSV